MAGHHFYFFPYLQICWKCLLNGRSVLFLEKTLPSSNFLTLTIFKILQFFARTPNFKGKNIFKKKHHVLRIVERTCHPFPTLKKNQLFAKHPNFLEKIFSDRFWENFDKIAKSWWWENSKSEWRKIVNSHNWQVNIKVENAKN